MWLTIAIALLVITLLTYNTLTKKVEKTSTYLYSIAVLFKIQISDFVKTTSEQKLIKI